MRSGDHAIWDARMSQIDRDSVKLGLFSAHAKAFAMRMSAAMRSLGITAMQAEEALRRLAAFEGRRP